MRGWKWLRVLSDIVVVAALTVTKVGLFVAEKTGSVVKRGFFCDDESIRFPLKESTVPYWALVIVSLCVPIATMVFGNLYEHYIHKRLDTNPHCVVGRCCRLAPWMLRLGYQLRWFLLGLIVTLVVTDIGKVSVGRLRPHFIAACDPDFSVINCTDEYGLPLYVTSYTCRGDSRDFIAARLSWPSGHASLSAYTFTFVALYVTSMRAFYPRSGLRLLLVLISLMLALLTNVSRLADNKHHPTDILSGSIIGATIAVIIVYYHLYFFSHFKKQEMSTMPNVSNTEPRALQSTELSSFLTDEEV